MGLTRNTIAAVFVMTAVTLGLGANAYLSANALGDAVESAGRGASLVDGAVAAVSDAVRESAAEGLVLASPRISRTDRADARRRYAQAMDVVESGHRRIAEAFGRDGRDVGGTLELIATAERAAPGIRAYADYGKAVADDFDRWEGTRISDPEGLLAALLRVRGEHDRLLRRAAETALAGGHGGRYAASDDVRACGGDAWRAVSSGGSGNPVLAECASRLAAPHRRLHAAAAAFDALALSGGATMEELAAAYAGMAAASDEVVRCLDRMAVEAERAAAYARKAGTGARAGMRPARAAALASLADIAERHIAAAAEADRRNLDAASRIRTSALLLTTLAAAVGLAVALFLRHSIRRGLTLPLEDVAASLNAETNRLSRAAERMTRLGNELADEAGGQAAALAGLSATLGDMAASTLRNAENARTADEIVRRTAAAVRDGAGAVADMNAAMREIGESAERMEGIAKVVENIAFQTSVLARRAEAEARRAGDAGGGFAAVAGEVRALARQSAAAARNTVELINGTVERVVKGTRVAGGMEAIFRAIPGDSREAERRIGRIVSTAREQATEMERMNRSIAKMDLVTRTSAGKAGATLDAGGGIARRAEGIRAAMCRIGTILGKEQPVPVREYHFVPVPEEPEMLAGKRTASFSR